MATQNEYSIFRRFQSIRTLRLLHLSAEISHLSDELGVVVEADRESDDPEKQMYESYYAQQMKSRSNTSEMQQAHLWHELDAKLRDYGTRTCPLPTEGRLLMFSQVTCSCSTTALPPSREPLRASIAS